ncbi:Transmembrane protein [Hirschfeldia incana]|nr:Transmembrane protein [Hirschfeldia incana]
MGVIKRWTSVKKKQKEEVEVTAKETHTWRRLRSMFSTPSSSFKWKRVDILHTEIVDGVVYNVMYVVEGVVLVSTLCFFYLCCGCHI